MYAGDVRQGTGPVQPTELSSKEGEQSLTLSSPQILHHHHHLVISSSKHLLNTLHILIHLDPSQAPREADAIIIPILQMKKQDTEMVTWPGTCGRYVEMSFDHNRRSSKAALKTVYRVRC